MTYRFNKHIYKPSTTNNKAEQIYLYVYEKIYKTEKKSLKFFIFRKMNEDLFDCLYVLL